MSAEVTMLFVAVGLMRIKSFPSTFIQKAVASLLTCSMLFAGAAVAPSHAAQRLSIRVGGAQRALDVEDLEIFVRTIASCGECLRYGQKSPDPQHQEPVVLRRPEY